MRIRKVFDVRAAYSQRIDSYKFTDVGVIPPKAPGLKKLTS